MVIRTIAPYITAFMKPINSLFLHGFTDVVICFSFIEKQSRYLW